MTTPKPDADPRPFAGSSAAIAGGPFARWRGQLDETAAPIGETAIGEAIRDFRRSLFAKMRKGALNAEQAGRLRGVLERARREIEEL